MNPALIDTADVLANGEMTIRGRFAEASNATLLVNCRIGNYSAAAVFKPQQGMRPLHDFDALTLPAREVAAYTLSEAAGWNCVPLTVWRNDSDFGPGSVQLFIDQPSPVDVIDVVSIDEVNPQMLIAVTGQDEEGDDVALVHVSHPDLRTLVLFDAVTNNADRKGGHILNNGEHYLGIDNGLTFHEQHKLRTVLWGWAGERFTAHEHDLLTRTASFLETSQAREVMSNALTEPEFHALGLRVAALIAGGVFPSPEGHRRSIPWPVF